MKVLLDECVTKRLKELLPPELSVFTVEQVGFIGLKNGKLLAAAVSQNFDILLTIDKNIRFQQQIAQFPIAIVVFDVFRSNIKYLAPLVPEFLSRLNTFEKGKVTVLS
jgi:predicted nuclease of predicted toxin-antitoxin system